MPESACTSIPARRAPARTGRLALAAGALLALPPAALAGISQGDITIELQTVASGLTAPVMATHAGDGSGRLFIVEQSGQIRILQDGVLLPAPFLDIADKLPDLGTFFDERGLLGLAFHPDYAANGRFFVRYSAPREGEPDEPCNLSTFIVGCHSEVLAEYHVTADPNVADPASEIILFSVDEPQFNHDAGHVAFGPDGLLYFSLGDGGGAHDGLADDPPSHGPIGHGQNIETALGSMIRIDVDGGSPYAIPPDNPFVGGPGLDEIYAYGFRNPYRFSFDRQTGELYVGDVGQNLFEEVDIVELGGNYGWVIREGTHCFDPFNPLMPPATCPATGPLGEPLIDPIAEYSHAEGGITVIGGFVYRGSRSPQLFGRYVFGDFSAQFTVPGGRLYYLDETSPGQLEIKEFRIGAADVPYGLFLKGFGEDEAGEIYACGSTALAPFGDTGVVQRITVPPAAALDIKPGSCPNPLNRNSNGVLPVGLLGTDTFDVTAVDVSTIRLSLAGAGDTFAATLGGDQEVPPVMSSAGGTATFSLDDSGPSLAYSIQLTGLDLDGLQTPDPGDNVAAMHIHNGPAGAAGPVVFGMISPGHDADDIVIDAAAGTVTGVWEDSDPSFGTLSDLLDELAAGQLYLNVHTPVHPAGEVRGQILASGLVAPHEGPPGPHTVIEDVGTPFGGEACDCHALGGDGVPDLSLKFRTQDVVEALALDLLPAGALVELEVSGNLLNGTPFSATDCVRLVPPGTGPGAVEVQSSQSGAWVGVTPLDETLDGGGFTDFLRTYPVTSVVTLTAEPSFNGQSFAGWMLDGAVVRTRLPVLTIVVVDQPQSIRAIYKNATAPDAPDATGVGDPTPDQSQNPQGIGGP